MDQPTRNATQRNVCLSFCCVLLRVCWSVCLSLSLSLLTTKSSSETTTETNRRHTHSRDNARDACFVCVFLFVALSFVFVWFLYSAFPRVTAHLIPPSKLNFFWSFVCVCQGSAFFVLVGFLAAHSIQLATQAGFFVCLFVCLFV
jgi:hypothetical protein